MQTETRTNASEEKRQDREDREQARSHIYVYCNRQGRLNFHIEIRFSPTWRDVEAATSASDLQQPECEKRRDFSIFGLRFSIFGFSAPRGGSASTEKAHTKKYHVFPGVSFSVTKAVQ